MSDYRGERCAGDVSGADPDVPDALYAASDPNRPPESDTRAEDGCASREVGVGPWPGGPDAWPDDPRYDPALLADGDRRNVVDRYRYWTIEAIRTDMAGRAHGLHVAVENISQDLNIGSIVRTANAFNVAAVHIIGRRRWNKRGAMVTNRYLDVRHHPEPDALLEWADDAGYEVIGIDNGPRAQLLEEAALPERCLMVFGSEGEGISSALLERCSRVLRIGQYGSTRSINVAAAAAVAMHAWVLQHAGPAPD
ncbi:TrmH family RNA methyltransferase [Actinomyces sp.]|uniref:TrmH family RNA methyltransferase n=1 Tax=Actinomyces sp. TaxID=29317 RepID=UPI0026DA7A46|nr:TrmH family RNA methyltransferase [Actinomyces sp.]MDO4900939.1 TrmH family RNA methyltransferase [Actinomyces sp.]